MADPSVAVKKRQARIPACITIGKARRALLRGIVHVRHVCAEVEGEAFKREAGQLRGELHSLRERLASLSTRVRRAVKVKRAGVANG